MFIIVFHILSVLVALVGSSMIIPLIVAITLGETSVILPFVIPMLASFMLFLIVHFITKNHLPRVLTTKATYITVALCWVISSIFAAIPLYSSGAIPSIIDALFESVSGFTTTGATILSDIESLPRSINLWRALAHWLGGMGIVALTVALLPLLGIGGFSLIKAETTGPEKSKITSKITTTAKILWLSYLILTIIEAILLKIAGMDIIDSITHAFSTLGTGGFSSRNASVAGFNSTAIDIIITIFMFLAGINFSLYFFIITRNFREVSDNSELKAYIIIVTVATLLVTAFTLKFYGSFAIALRYSAFQVVSIITTTGFGTADYTQWPSAAQFVIFLLFFIGGCSGSTGGGVKVVRHVILFKSFNTEAQKLLHPHGIFSVRLNKKSIAPDLISNVASFITIYMTLVLITTFIGCLCNMDLFTSATAAISMVGNVGPAFAKLSPAFTCSKVPGLVKIWYCVAMIAGRLELYTLLIFFTPAFWKK